MLLPTFADDKSILCSHRNVIKSSNILREHQTLLTIMVPTENKNHRSKKWLSYCYITLSILPTSLLNNSIISPVSSKSYLGLQTQYSFRILIAISKEWKSDAYTIPFLLDTSTKLPINNRLPYMYDTILRPSCISSSIWRTNKRFYFFTHLSNRFFHSRIENSLSLYGLVEVAFQQGSILSLILYNLYTSDLP